MAGENSQSNEILSGNPLMGTPGTTENPPMGTSGMIHDPHVTPPTTTVEDIPVSLPPMGHDGELDDEQILRESSNSPQDTRQDVINKSILDQLSYMTSVLAEMKEANVILSRQNEALNSKIQYVVSIAANTTARRRTTFVNLEPITTRLDMSGYTPVSSSIGTSVSTPITFFGMPSLNLSCQTCTIPSGGPNTFYPLASNVLTMGNTPNPTIPTSLGIGNTFRAESSDQTI